eukprot:7435546-Pyramimonas_sp.AAC.1
MIFAKPEPPKRDFLRGRPRWSVGSTTAPAAASQAAAAARIYVALSPVAVNHPVVADDTPCNCSRHFPTVPPSCG